MLSNNFVLANFGCLVFGSIGRNMRRYDNGLVNMKRKKCTDMRYWVSKIPPNIGKKGPVTTH